MEETQDVKIKDFRISASEVQERISGIRYLLPQEEALCNLLRERKLAPMPVTDPAQADFTTHDKEAFLKFLRVSGIKSVMFCYEHYTDGDLDVMYSLSEAERAFFRTHPCSAAEYFGDQEEIPDVEGLYEMSDHSYWMEYQKYIRQALDLSYPKSLRLYALYQGKVFVCELEDLWLDRLSLLNAQDIRQECINTRNYSGYGKGVFHFLFENDTVTDEETETAAEQTENSEADEPTENE